MVELDAFTTDDQTELNQSYFASGDKNVLAGVWECAPCKEEIESYISTKQPDPGHPFTAHIPES